MILRSVLVRLHTARTD